MADFDPLRARLGSLRDERGALRATLLAAREDVRRGRRESAKTLERLEAREREIDAENASLWKDFQGFVDPREALARLADHAPILLLPLRLETRFKTGAEGRRQLWVRVYPDDCLVDSFEPSLTEAEVNNARVFWANVWRAGGVEAQERAAWRDLAASHGVGRAGWIVGAYQPLAPADKPQRDTPTDVLLIVPVAAPLPAAAADFWARAWRAGGDPAAVQAGLPALIAVIGEAAARAVLAEPPVNLADAPVDGHTRATTTVKVAGLRMTALADMPARRASWSSAPRVELLPERLVLMGWRGGKLELEVASTPILTPLAAGPDPNAAPAEQLAPQGDTLNIPEPLRWMFDFEAALKAGMAFRVDLTSEQAASGFDKLVVLGVRIADDAARGRRNLEQLVEHHLHSRAGLSIVPQGTPTNNTEKGGAGLRFGDDPEAGFDAFFRQQPLYAVEADPRVRRDGQWLADALGLPHPLVQRIPNAEGQDQADARAMQRALWPGTLGYMMRTMLAPLFTERDIDATRAFMADHALGRGVIPALRVGEQPYGILPITAFGRIDWLRNPRLAARETAGADYLARLLPVLRRIDADWAGLVGRVAHVGQRGGDPHQVLLDVLGLNPTSVEYHTLQADSAEHHFAHLSLVNFPIALSFVAALVAKNDAMDLLRTHGYAGSAEPEAITKLFSERQPPLDGPVVDEPPLSETERLTAVAGGRNYIEWLIDAAGTDIEAIQEERGFDAGKRPRALLYLLLRHAMQLAYHLVGVRQSEAVQADAEALATFMAEPKFVHVASTAPQARSESRYAVLMDAAPSGKGLRIADLISRNLRRIDPELTEQVEALEHLAGASTARLERAFAEHIDGCSFRIDAWKQGILHWQLARMRAAAPSTDQPSTDGPSKDGPTADGLYLGAFGWLEDVRPDNQPLVPKLLPADVAAQVDRPGDPPLMHDPANDGLIHAPSINQATTAAVLRNAYLSHGGQMAVDLSSRRVRLALGILEGLRNGQPLGALLGYHVERQLQDSATITVQTLVFELRRQFPLVANRIADTQDASKPIEAIAAMNVVDGLKLVRHVAQATVKTYPTACRARRRRCRHRSARSSTPPWPTPPTSTTRSPTWCWRKACTRP